MTQPDPEINPSRLIKFAIGLAILVIGSLLFVLLILRLTVYSSAHNYGDHMGSKRPKTGVSPQVPHLQISPSLDFELIRQRQELHLHRYGWVDPVQGIVHIPIDQAMEQIAQMGQLPLELEPALVPPSNASSQTPPTQSPGEIHE